MTERTLDRLPEFDDRSRAYNVRTLLATDQPRSYTWGCPAWLNQGREGACVGFSWAHEHAARPYERPADYALALALYREAQKLDPWPGEDYSGTSVLAGAKAAHARGHLSEYRWAFNVNDALTAISRRGPAVIGVWWWTGMFRPDADGFIHPTGSREGGHAILVRGVNVKRRTVTLRNSWGAGWGRLGDCYLSWDDFGSLLADGGECCIPVKRGP